MKKKNNEIFIVLMILVSGIGLCAESFLFHWEFWVPPLILLAMIGILVLYVLKHTWYSLRKTCYFLFTFLALFYHGVHKENMIDIGLAVCFSFVTFTLLDSLLMLRIFYTEYIVLIGIRIFILTDWEIVPADAATVAGILFSVLVVSLTYWMSARMLRERKELLQLQEQNEKKNEAADADTENFLINISQELRTPVNVINGMSEILIGRHGGAEADAIRGAGIRLAQQLEDLGDYIECKRQKVLPQEAEYMCTSLVNDVVNGFRSMENTTKQELVMDLDPMVPSRLYGDARKIHKIFRHLLENAVKYTEIGGIYIRVFAEEKEYGVNLCIEMTDTGIGMDRRLVAAVSEGKYPGMKQKKRNSGIGLGLFIVYGFVHRMGGFVKIESEKNVGTTVRVTLPQKVVDKSPCLALNHSFNGDLIFHVRQDKYTTPAVRDFYRSMATNLATGIHVSLYPAQTVQEIEKLREKLHVAMIFMGQEEYEDNPAYFNALSKMGIAVAVSAAPGFRADPDSTVHIMPKPLYAYHVIKALNEGRTSMETPASVSGKGGNA